MITPYVRPQDTITQILQQTAQRQTSRRNPIVIGPQYTLFLNDGRNLTAGYRDFNVLGEEALDYVDTLGAAINMTLLKPHTTSAQLFGSKLNALVATIGSELMELDATDQTARRLRIVTDTLAGSGTLNSALEGRKVKVGDIISADWDDSDTTGTTKRTVVGLLGVITPASTNHVGLVGALNPVTQGAAAAAKVAANSTATLAVVTPPTIAAADVLILRAAGKVVLVSGEYKLADTLDITCTTAGDNDASPTAAVFTVTSLATGITATGITAGDGGPGTDYTINLTTVGYTGGTVLTITKTGDMVIGDKIRVTLRPAFTAATDLDVDGTYTGTVNRRYAIEVTALDTAGSEIDLNIFDVAGNDPAVAYENALCAGDIDVGTSGLTINPATFSGYAKGQIFYIDATAAVASTTEFDGVILDGPLVPSINVENAGAVEDVEFDEVRIYQAYSGVLDDRHTESIDPALVTSVDDWDYAADLGLPSSLTGRNGSAFSPFADAIGSVYLSYKALVIPLPTEALIEITREVDVVPKVGETSFENWLGRGSLEAFRGNQNRLAYALRTGGDSVEDFTIALRKIQTTDRIYALAGMTDDEDVMLLLRDHCTTQSNKFKKNFRRAYVGTDSPGAYVHWGALPAGDYRIGDLSSSHVILDVEFRETSKFLPTDVGSTIQILDIGQTYTITEFISDYEVVTDAPDVTSQANSGLILTRADTPENAALFVIDRSVSFSNRRIVNIWSDDPTRTENGVTTVVPMKFVAAEIAGLRCALLPQQGLTMTELLSVTAAPSMFTTFEPELLDEIAANGTFIVTQESEGGDVFIRHQLTTSTDEGALAYEDNVGVIVDEFAYAVKDSFREYIGRRNATPDTIAEIDDKLKALAISFTQTELVNRQIGPAVLTFFSEKGEEGEVTVRQDGDLADTLMTYVKLRVPLPLNGINHYIDVEATELLTSQDNATA